MPIAVTDTPKSVKFQGVLDIPIYTTITGYANPSGLAFAQGQLQPGICTRIGSAPDIVPTGVQADIFEPDGVTSFTLGNTPVFSASELNSPLPTWWNGRLTGLAFQRGVGASDFFAYGYAADLDEVGFKRTLGISRILHRAFIDTAPFMMGQCAMQTTLGVGFAWNANGSSDVSFLFIDPNTGFVSALIDQFSGIPFAGAAFAGCIPSAISGLGLDWLTYNDSTGFLASVFATDWNTFGSFFSLTWDNPTIDAAMKAIAWNQANSTPFGFVTYTKGSVTIGGRTYNPYGVLTSPDGGKWWLINLIPQDKAAGNAWISNPGSAGIMIDAGGITWFMNTGPDPSKVFSSFGQSGILITYLRPPIPLVVNPGLYK